jgi:hypothetical protein
LITRLWWQVNSRQPIPRRENRAEQGPCRQRREGATVSFPAPLARRGLTSVVRRDSTIVNRLAMKIRGICLLALAFAIKGAVVGAVASPGLTASDFQFSLPSGPLPVSIQEWPEATYAFVTIGRLTPEQRLYGFLRPAPPGSTNQQRDCCQKVMKKASFNESLQWTAGERLGYDSNLLARRH